MNQVHYIDNQYNYNFQPISIDIVNNFMKCINLFHNEHHIMCRIFLITPHTTQLDMARQIYYALAHTANIPPTIRFTTA